MSEVVLVSDGHPTRKVTMHCNLGVLGCVGWHVGMLSVEA